MSASRTRLFTGDDVDEIKEDAAGVKERDHKMMPPIIKQFSEVLANVSDEPLWKIEQ